MKYFSIAGPFFLVMLWSFVHYTGLVIPLWLPSPYSTAIALVNFLATFDGMINVLSTVARIIIGFTLSCLIGIPIGLLMGRWEKFEQSLIALVDFFRSLPALSLFPLFMMIFGLGEASKIATVVISCSLVIIVNTSYGVKSCNDLRVYVAKLLGATEREIFFKVVLLEALPHIYTGLRISLSLSIVVVIVTEMMGVTNHGLGYLIFQHYQSYRMPEMYSMIIITGLLGYILNKLAISIESKIIHCQAK